MEEKVKVYNGLPDGYKVLNGTLTAPNGFTWIYNSQSLFNGNVEYAFMRNNLHKE